MGQTASAPAGGNIGFSLLAAAIYAGDWPTGQGGPVFASNQEGQVFSPLTAAIHAGQKKSPLQIFCDDVYADHAQQREVTSGDGKRGDHRGQPTVLSRF